MKSKHIYQNIVEDIRNSIIKGELGIGQKLPTEMEIVEQYATSRPTVSKAMEVLVSQGYIVREQGRGSFVADRDKELKIRSMNVVSLILPFGGGEGVYHRTEILLIRGIEAELKKAGYYLMVHYVDVNAVDEEIQIIKKCRYELSDGIIVYPSSLNDMFLELFDMALDDYPMVFLTQMGDPSFVFVGSDNIRAGYLATRHLLDRGFEDIFFLSPYRIASNYTLRERYMGYTNALKEQGLRMKAANVWENLDFWKPGELQQRVKAAAARGRRAGFFATQENISIQVLDILEELGISVPHDAGVIGIDFHDMLVNTKWQITSIQQDLYGIGAQSARTVIDRIKGKKLSSNEIKMDVSFLTGETT